MSSLLSQDVYVTPEEYLAAEEISEVRHEYRAGVVQEMAGGTRTHSDIIINLVVALGSQLAGRRCRVYASDMRVRIRDAEPMFYYYADVMVDCSGSHENEVTEPTVIFEVLSPSTARSDRGDKLVNYLALPTMRVYALVDQDQQRVTVYRRRQAGAWPREVLTGPDATLELPEIDCRLPLTTIYAGVTPPPV